jgi:pyruvate dehydrogenase E2 component (dihydrolipoamide acetyltransferase)
MPRAIVMPTMGMYTDEGVLSAWLLPAGTRVGAGDAVAEITTEKTAFEVPAPASGILHPVAEPGTNLRVEALMGYILADGEMLPAAPAGAAVQPANGEVSAQAPAPEERSRPIASPAARRSAAQHGIDLAQVKGSGPGGRIVEADILAVTATPSGARRILRRMPMTGTRKGVAERLRSTLSAAASTTLTREADADVLVAARRRLAGQPGGAPSYNAVFIGLLARALREFPEWNAAIEGDSIVVFDEVNIGFAVAVPGGLVVPVVRDADRHPLAEIAACVAGLTERALSGRLRPADVEGGTASISNLGGHGIDAFTPILNGTQSVILGIGRIAERPVVRDGALTARHTCTLNLTFDHRVADGVPAARMLDAIVRRMSQESEICGIN